MSEKVLENKKPAKFKLPKFLRRKPKFDEEGNPIYYKKKKLFKYKRVNRSFGGDMTMFICLLIGGCFMAFPLVYAISNSLKPMTEIWLFPPTYIVRNPTFKNYSDLFTIMSNSLVPFSRYLFNTFLITIIGTTFRVISASLCAYPLSKRKFKGRNLIFQVSRLSMMFTVTANGISTFILFAWLGWLDTWLCILIPSLGNAFSLYLMKQYMDDFPDTILEAASIDGAGEFRKFFTILMPSIKPGWITLIVFAVQEFWNSGASIYIYKEELKTLSYALSQIASAGVARTGVSNAISVVMLIVPVVTFVISQSQIIETMATSGMKD